MGQGYLVDTNAVIDYIDNRLPEKTAMFIDKLTMQISIISRIELLAWPKARDNQLKILQAFIGEAKVFTLTEPVIVETIRIRKNFRIKLPDAIIAATAIVFNLTLITRNTSDFNDVDGLQLLNPYEM